MDPTDTVNEIAGTFTGPVAQVVVALILLLALKLVLGKALLKKISKNERRRR